MIARTSSSCIEKIPEYSSINCHLVDYEETFRVFRIKVWNQNNPRMTWVISRRYSDFYKLFSDIQGSSFGLEIPPKFYSIYLWKSKAIDERIERLSKLCSDLINNPFLKSYYKVVQFFCASEIDGEKPKLSGILYSLFNEKSKYLTGNRLNFGWRLNKYYIACFNKDYNKKEQIASIYTDCSLLKELKTTSANIRTFIDLFDEKYIKSPIDFIYDRQISFIYPKNDSYLDDLIYKYDSYNFLKRMVWKYERKGKPLKNDLIIKFSLQLYEAILYLHRSGIFHGHVHSGNILIENNNIKLCEMENSFVGLPHRDINFFMKIAFIENIYQIDILGYAFVLYEMMYGEIPKNSFLRPFAKLEHKLSDFHKFLCEIIVLRKIKYTLFSEISFPNHRINISYLFESTKLLKEKEFFKSYLLKHFRIFEKNIMGSVSRETEMIKNIYNIINMKQDISKKIQFINEPLLL